MGMTKVWFGFLAMALFFSTTFCDEGDGARHPAQSDVKNQSADVNAVVSSNSVPSSTSTANISSSNNVIGKESSPVGGKTLKSSPSDNQNIDQSAVKSPIDSSKTSDQGAKTSILNDNKTDSSPNTAKDKSNSDDPNKGKQSTKTTIVPIVDNRSSNLADGKSTNDETAASSGGVGKKPNTTDVKKPISPPEDTKKAPLVEDKKKPTDEKSKQQQPDGNNGKNAQIPDENEGDIGDEEPPPPIKNVKGKGDNGLEETADGEEEDYGKQPVDTKKGSPKVNKVAEETKAGRREPAMISNEQPPQSDFDDGPQSSHFLAYIITIGVLCAAAYILAHNRHKIMGLILEGRGGRRSQRSGSTGGKGVRYKRLQPDEADGENGLLSSRDGGRVIY